MHVDGGLEVGGGRENLALADGKGRVALNDPCAYAAERLNAKRPRRHIQKEKPLDASGAHAPLQTLPLIHISKDLDTGKAQAITITATSNMSREEIDRAVRDAQQYAAEDEKLKAEALSLIHI